MAEKKKGKGSVESDETTTQILPKYRKKSELLGSSICQIFRDKLDQINEDAENLQSIHIWTELNPVGVQSIFETLSDLEYKFVTSIRLIKTRCQDEGLQHVIKYLKQPDNVITFVDLLDNEITSLGCQNLGLALKMPCFIQRLKLDHNPIGTEGLRLLLQGLSTNTEIISLSLNFCNIESDAGCYLQQLVAQVDSKMEKLKLAGNFLKNEGIFKLFQALQYNNVIEKLDITDNQFGEHPTIPIIDKICEVITQNNSLGVYKMKYNGIYDESALKFLEALKSGKHVYVFEISEHIDANLAADIKAAIKKNKPKKKAKAGKKKK